MKSGGEKMHIKNYDDLFVEDDISTGEHILFIDKDKKYPFNGLVVDYFNDKLSWEFEVKNGFKTGIEKVYYPTGELAELNQTDHNTINGIAKEYHRNGKLKSQSIVIRNVHINVISYDDIGGILEEWEISETDPSYNIVCDKILEYRRNFKLEY